MSTPIPPLPPGFELESQGGAMPPPPPGFELEGTATPREPTWTERVLSKMKGVGRETYRGAQQGFAGMGRQLGVALEATQQKGSYLNDLGGTMQEVWGDVEQATERPKEVSDLPWYDPERVAGTTSQAAMPMLPGLAAGAAVATAGAPVLVGAGVGGAIAGFQEAESFYRQRIAEGIPEPQAYKEALIAFPIIGALNVLPFKRILGREPGRLLTAALEAGTEIAEEPVQAAISGKDPVAATIEGAKEVGIPSLILGGLLGGGSGAAPAPAAETTPSLGAIRRAYPEGAPAPDAPKLLPPPPGFVVDTEGVAAKPGQERPARRLIEGPQPSGVLAVNREGAAAPLTETEADQARRAAQAQQDERLTLGEQQLGRRAPLVPESLQPRPAQPQTNPTEPGRAPDAAAEAFLPAALSAEGVRPIQQRPPDRPAVRRNFLRPQAQHDSILEYLSKTRGHGTTTRGINLAEAVAQGLDPHRLNQTIHGINRAFTRGGMSFDHAAELLAEAGYPVRNERGEYDQNKLLDLIGRELAGNKTFSEQNTGWMQAEYDAREEDFAAAGAAPSEDTVDVATLAAEAIELDPDAYERAAIQYTDDDAGYAAAVRAIVENARAGNRRGGESDRGESEAGTTEPSGVSEPGGLQGYADVQRSSGRDAGEGRGAESWSQATRVKGKDGRPARVYRGANASLSPEHFRPEALGRASGHPSSGLGVWFSADRGDAAGYGPVEDFRLDIRNPFVVKFESLPEFESVEAAARWRERLRARGFDGIVIDGRSIGATTQFVVFEPGQAIPGGSSAKAGVSEDAPTYGSAQVDTAPFRKWFGNSKVVDDNGRPLRVYHGAGRLDRFGPRILKTRATSGPMPFFTNSPELASTYSIGKQDNSLPDNAGEYGQWFTVRVKGRRAPLPIAQAWWQLSPQDRQRIAKQAPQVRRDNDGNIILDPDNRTGPGGYDWAIQEARGNHLEALIDQWLLSGTLFGQEREFLRVLKLAGMDVAGVDYTDGMELRSGVAPVYLSIQRPLDAAIFEQGNYTQEAERAEQALRAAAKRRRASLKFKVDQWDKRGISGDDWLTRFEEGVLSGNQYAFTVIPDWATNALRALGYDGILDSSGKGGGALHDVWIPFDAGQIKSAIGNRGTFDRDSDNMVREQQGDLFGGARSTSQAPSLEQRQEAVGAKLRGDKSIPADINRPGDLFSRQVDLIDEATKPTELRVKATEPSGTVDAFVPVAQRPAVQGALGKIGRRVTLRQTGVFQSGFKTVDTPEQAAHVMAPLRKEPQESLMMLVLDASNRPIAILRHTTGSTDGSMAEISTLLGPLFAIDGAAKVYMAHQHPSGVASQSNADTNLTDKLTATLLGTGIEFLGSLVVAPGTRQATLYTTTNLEQGISIPAASRKQPVPVVQRRFSRSPSRVRMRTISNPSQAAAPIAASGVTFGVALLDNRNNLQEVIPLNPVAASTLRTGDPATGFGELAKAAHDTNAKAAIIVAPKAQWNRVAVKNLGAALHGLDIRVLDVVDSGAAESAVTSPQGLPTFGGKFFSNPIAEVYQAYQRAARRVLAVWNDRFGYRWDVLGKLPGSKDYLIRRYQSLGDVKRAQEIARSLYDALAQADATDQVEAYDYLTTRGAVPTMIGNPEVRAAAVRAKQLIDKIGQQLVAAGLLSPAAYSAHEGEYLPRVYLKHLLGEQNYRSLGNGKKLSDLGYLKKRKDLPKDYRKVVLGEITDPAFLASFSVSRTLRDLALVDFLHDIAGDARWVPPGATVQWGGRSVSPFWLRAEAKSLFQRAQLYGDAADKAAAIQLAGRMEQAAEAALQTLGVQDLDQYKQIPDSPRYGALRGLWVRSEIADDLIGAQQYLSPDPSAAESWLGSGGKLERANQWWKFLKVGANPPSQLRNAMSNLMLLQLSGVPIYRIPGLLTKAIQDMRAGGPYTTIAKKYGIFAMTFANTELRHIEHEWLDLQRRGATNHWQKAQAMLGVMADKSADFHSNVEAVFKIAKLIDAMEREGKSQQEAMIDAHDAMFDYSRVPRSVAYLRRVPLGAPFLTFYYKALPRLATTAITDPLRFAPYVGVAYVLQELIKNAYDVDDDDLKKLRAALPLWMRERGHAMLLPWKDQNGRWQVIDVGYIVPWGMFADAWAQTTEGSGMRAIDTMGFLSGPVPDVIVALKTNTDAFTKRDIMDPARPPQERLMQLMSYVWSLAAPPFLTEHGAVGQTYKALAGKVDPRTGEQKLTPAQAAARLFGISIYPVDPQESVQKNVQQMKRDIQDKRSAMRKALSDRNNTEADRKRVREVYLEIIRRDTEAMKQYIQDTRLNPKLLRDPNTTEEGA